jgi:ABC-type phosphate transport system substrate-binding protein
MGVRRAHAADNPTISGGGSSFAGIEFQQWTRDAGGAPYNLKVNYQSSSSGAGRQQFRDKTVDFGVTDIRYNKFDGSPPPDNTYIYVPITAGGIAVMYNLKKHGFGETDKPIQLSDYSLCAIFTGGVAYWDDGPIKQDNPGVTLPHQPVTPVMRSDPAGTNFVLEEYCIAKQQQLYFAFADAATKTTGQDYPKEPTSSWPIVKPIVGADGSEGAADTVASANNDGYVTAVETGYAAQRHFPVASVKNSNGKYVLPTEDDVASALSFATQLSDGTHQLNFSPPRDNAYNPSTYSYLLARTTGFDAAKGGTLTAFANYALTIGQTEAGKLKYATIGRSLINFGLEILKKVPGHVDPTADELKAIPAAGANEPKTTISASQVSTGGTPTSVAGGSTSNSTGSTASTGSTTPGSTGSTTGSTAPASTTGSTAPGASPAAAGPGSPTGTGSGSPGTGSGASSSVKAAGTGGASGIDPSVSVDPMARTGAPHQVLAAFGLALVLVGEWARTSLRRRRSVA